MPPRSSRNLPYAKVTRPEDPPLRPERHVPNSIATMRRRLVAALATTLSRCPCCAARNRYPNLRHSKTRSRRARCDGPGLVTTRSAVGEHVEVVDVPRLACAVASPKPISAASRLLLSNGVHIRHEQSVGH